MSRSLFINIILACALTACSNMVKPHKITGPEIAALTAQPSTLNGLNESDQNAATYNCPASANVVPDYDWNFNSTGYFTVCPSKANLTDILVHGSAPVAGPVCVFPAEIASNGQVFAKPDVNKADGSPWVQCLTPTADGIHATFPGISWNAVFIVAAQDVRQMSLCLQGGVYSYCPRNYSFGSFR